MQFLSLAVFFVVVAAASAGLHAGIVGGLGSPAVIAGPSGTVIRSGVAHGSVIAGVPAVHGLGAVVAPGLLGHGLLGHGLLGNGLLGHGLLGHGLVGSGIEGQWVPDINEHLYDDGSYKPHVYGH